MNGGPPAPVTLVCCSVFAAEVKALRPKHWPGLVLRFLDSLLHMQPERLTAELEAIVAEELGRGHRVVLIYGDCSQQMTALAARPGVARTRGGNCCELLLGREEYRRLAREGAFFLLPEWTGRWRQIFTSELGLNRDNATSLMQDMHRKLIYLDTGQAPVSAGALRACAQYCGLPWETRPVSLESLRAAIQEALTRLEADGDTP